MTNNTQTQHTPGPWQTEYKTREEAEISTVPVDNGNYSDGVRIEAIDRANANLIAAAPDMLEALQRAFEHIGDWSEHGNGSSGEENQLYFMVEKAIKKAHGEV